MIILLLFVLLIICVLFPFLRCVLFNPHLVSFYGSTDIYHYFKLKKYNDAPIGEFRIYCGQFGKGKTLTAVHYICSLFRKYDNKPVWDSDLKRFVIQKVIVVSNVKLNIPYIPFTSFAQMVHPPQPEDENLRYVYYFLGDEFSVLCNSRDYAKNFSTELLMSLLTCRHLRMSLVLTSQKFILVDKILRENCRDVIECNKIWRLQGLKVYDGSELENCTNPELVKAKARGCWFVRNRDFAAYDTMALVDVIQKKIDDHDFLSDQEILERLGDNTGDSVTRYSHRASKRKPHKKKYA